MQRVLELSPLALLLLLASCGPAEQDQPQVETATRAIVLDNLAGTASLLGLEETITVDVGRWTLGEVPNDVVVRDGRAFVVNSGSHTVQVLDLSADPAEATVQEVFLGDGTNPMSQALLGEGMLLVSLFMTDQLALVDLEAGKVVACVDLPSGDDLLPLEGMEPLARPQSIALTGDGRALVTLNNLDVGWAPAGRGLIAVVDLGDFEELMGAEGVTCGPSGSEEQTPEGAPGVLELIDLGEECLVPAFIEIHEGRAFVTCGGTWGADEGRLAVIDLRDLSVVSSARTGGMPGPMLIAGEMLLMGDGLDGRAFAAGLDGEVLHDYEDPIVLCPSDPDEGLFQYVAGLAAAPGGEVLASCFASSEVLRFAYEPGASEGPLRHARSSGKVTTGDGAGVLAVWEAPK